MQYRAKYTLTHETGIRTEATVVFHADGDPAAAAFSIADDLLVELRRLHPAVTSVTIDSIEIDR